MIKIVDFIERRGYFKNSCQDVSHIKDLYYKYLDSLKTYVAECGSNYEFLSYNDYYLENLEFRNSNPYCNDGIVKLGLSLKSIGSYWPLFFEIRNGFVQIREGVHRVLALREVGSYQKILSLPYPRREHTDLNLRMPLIWPGNEKEMIYLDTSYKEVVEVSENEFEIGVISNLAAFSVLVGNSIFLSEMMFNCDKVVYPSPVVNDEDKFDEWLR